jgi:ABC-type multidrug transport system fused ATPase/permease subunit
VTAAPLPREEGDDMREERETRPAPIPWRRVAGLLRPLRRGIAAMVALSVGGVLVGLVPPLALGLLVDALIERNDKPEAVVLTAIMAIAVALEAGAYILSDGMYARNASRLYRNTRVQMFAGALRRARSGEETSGLSSRFISDVQTLEGITMVLLDSGSMAVVGFGSAFVAVLLLQPWSAAVIVPALAGIWIVTRRTQEPVASAGQHRQEELEAMTDTMSQELERSNDPEGAMRFASSTERLLDAEVKLGWLQALNLQGSGGLAKLGPIAVVVVAAFVGTQYMGTLISLYLLAQRVFWSFDGLVDLSLGMNSVRGPVARCFELIDTPEVTSGAPVAAGSWGV